jgi:hypothetical protein
MSKLFEANHLKVFQRTMEFLTWLEGVVASYSYTHLYTPISLGDWHRSLAGGDSAPTNSAEELKKIQLLWLGEKE